MKQVAIIAIGTIILMGAIVISAEQSPMNNKGGINAPMSYSIADGYSTIVIDSCEYIEGYNRLAHKGNCKFCANRRREELKMIDELNKEE